MTDTDALVGTMGNLLAVGIIAGVAGKMMEKNMPRQRRRQRVRDERPVFKSSPKLKDSIKINKPKTKSSGKFTW
jgi:hypothetical protein